ncbi:MAG TPA: bacitracin ABC transporter ATP-binding protein [Chitinophagaceae bacterium]|nr:bacitracin ABC transporter ATP-binding protein [Chitinophagaceae bacterium]
MALVTVSRLTKKFRTHVAVDDLSFSVNEGDVYGFLGQNGAGKSTTIRMLLTLVAPTAGHIEIFGLDLKKERKKILSQVGAVIEKPDLYKYLSAYENLSLFARMSGTKIGKKELFAQLDMVGLGDRRDDKVKTFSQGMKQRLGIAVSLIHNPRLIILDEPTNGLDPQGIADMRNLILHLSRHLHKTIIVSSHLLYEIEQISTRMLIIDEGKKMVEGSVATLMDPSKTLVEAEVPDPGKAANLLKPTSWFQYLQKTTNHTLVFQLPKELIPDLNRELVQLQIDVLSLQAKNSLEAYFLSLTRTKQHVAAFTD